MAARFPSTVAAPESGHAMHSRRIVRKSPKTQRGVIALAIVAAIAMISTYLLVNSIRKTTSEVTVERDARTRQSLQEAKAALIAYAASQAWKAVDKDDQPGALPCPSADDNGTAATACTSAGTSSSASTRLGRFPWKTIGTTDLRDASGQVLWYALSNTFRKVSGTTVINSDTQGTLTVYDDQNSTSTPVQSSVVAVIIAPGQAVSGQNRSNNTVSDYLECRNAQVADTFSVSAPAASNSGSCPYSSGTVVSQIFNDQVIVVTQADLMAVVEPAVAARLESDIKPALRTYYTQWGGFPYPANFTGGPGHPGTTKNNSTAPPTSTNRAQSTYTGDNSLSAGRGLLPVSNSMTYPWVSGSGAVAITAGTVSSTVSSISCATVASPSGWRCSFSLNSFNVGSGYLTSDTCLSGGIRYQYCIINPSFTVAGDVSNAGLSLAVISPTTATDVTVTSSGGATRTMSAKSIAGSLKSNGRGTLTFSGTHTYSNYRTSAFTRTMVVTIPDRVSVSSVTSSTDATAGWFTNNEWYRQIYYVVSTGHLPGGGNSCSTSASPRCLTVSGLPSATYPTSNDKRAILILGGYALGTSTRPSGTLSNYLEGNNATPGGSNGYTYAHTIGSVKTTNDRTVVLSP